MNAQAENKITGLDGSDKKTSPTKTEIKEIQVNPKSGVLPTLNMPENPLKEKDQNKNVTEKDSKDSNSEADVKKEVPLPVQPEILETKGNENVSEEKYSDDSAKAEQTKSQEKKEVLTLVVPEGDNTISVPPIPTSPISPTKASAENQTPGSQQQAPQKNFFKKFGLKKKNQDPSSSPTTEIDISASQERSPDQNVEPTTEEVKEVKEVKEVTKVNPTETVTQNDTESKNFFKKLGIRKTSSVSKNQEPPLPSSEVTDRDVSTTQAKSPDSSVETTTEEVAKVKVNATEVATENDMESKNFFKKFTFDKVKKPQTKNQEPSSNSPPSSEAPATDATTKTEVLASNVGPAIEEATKSEVTVENDTESKNFFKKLGFDKIKKPSTKNQEPSPPSTEDSATATQNKSPDSQPEGSDSNAELTIEETIKSEVVTENEAESKEEKTAEDRKKNNFSLRFADMGRMLVERIREGFDELDQRMYQNSEDTREVPEVSEREELLGKTDDSTASVSPNKNPVVNGTKEAIAELGDALNERGEKLGMVNEQVTELAANADSFAALAREAMLAQKNKKWYQW
ncbi:13874_t:CDS:2 [Acaulospora morrowiae]|uniref:13874_t:CDS:1 n=1 Tax=Acaulospora morrowiae TaxID=94023 RepID=A0A9N9GMX2_9GLOM|nr:13874_t:CDS:2 [Acaulospora morrowiae]